eukprot:1179956-Prorocentrum_minimum.AAC.1
MPLFRPHAPQLAHTNQVGRTTDGGVSEGVGMKDALSLITVDALPSLDDDSQLQMAIALSLKESSQGPSPNKNGAEYRPPKPPLRSDVNEDDDLQRAINMSLMDMQHKANPTNSDSAEQATTHHPWQLSNPSHIAAHPSAPHTPTPTPPHSHHPQNPKNHSSCS